MGYHCKNKIYILFYCPIPVALNLATYMYVHMTCSISDLGQDSCLERVANQARAQDFVRRLRGTSAL